MDAAGPGEFRIRGLAEMEEPDEVHCRMRLNLDGILEVTAIEKGTGKSKNITISNARKPERLIPATAAFAGDASALVARGRALLDTMHPDDREETINLIEDIEQAVNSGDAAAYQKASHALGELLFFVGGKE
jgi:molecular chaperone DnaK (HSP70)